MADRCPFRCKPEAFFLLINSSSSCGNQCKFNLGDRSESISSGQLVDQLNLGNLYSQSVVMGMLGRLRFVWLQIELFVESRSRGQGDGLSVTAPAN